MAGPLDEVGDYGYEEEPPPPPPPPQYLPPEAPQTLAPAQQPVLPVEDITPEPVRVAQYSRTPQNGDLDEQERRLYERLPYTSGDFHRQTSDEIRGVQAERRAGEREVRTGEREQRAVEHAVDRSTRDQERALRRQERADRFTAKDLANRGIPTYRDAQGIAPVTDEAGAPLLHMDKRNNIAYDSAGNPRVVSYEGETGAPSLRDPFEGLPSRTDPKTGDQYQVAKGLPWQWTGVDPEVKARRMRETKDKALAKESQLLGRKLSLDHADLVAGKAEHDAMMKELQQSVPTLQDPRFAGADRDTILKAVDEHFNTEYAQPQANDTNGWFSKELSPEAQQLRSHIDKRKADAIETASGLFELKDRLNGLKERVAQGRDQQRAELDTMIAHQRGEAGPLDQPEQQATGAQGAQPTPGQPARPELPPNFGPQQASGMIEPGNIDWNRRPVVQNGDGTVSTVKAMNFGTSKGEVLVPTIDDDGREMTKAEAVKKYQQTGQHLGIFVGPESASGFARVHHNEMGPPEVQEQKELNMAKPEAVGRTLDEVQKDEVGTIERLKEVWQKAEWAPYASSVVEIHDLLQIGAAAKRLQQAETAGKTGSVEDAQLVNKWLERSQRNSTFGAKVVGFLSQSAAFGGEIAGAVATLATGGEGIAGSIASRAGVQAGKQGLKSLIEGNARRIIERQVLKALGTGAAAKTTARLVGKTAGKLALAPAVTAIAAPLRITAQHVQQQLPVKLGVDEENRLVAMANDDKDGFFQSVGKAALDQHIEVLSEMTGGLTKYIPRPKLIQGLKTAILAKLGMKGALGPLAAKLKAAGTTAAKYAAWNGAVGEVAEEYIGGLMRVGTGTPVDQAFPATSDLPAMILAFSIPGAAKTAGVAALNRWEQNRAAAAAGGAPPAGGVVPPAGGAPAGGGIVPPAGGAPAGGGIVPPAGGAAVTPPITPPVTPPVTPPTPPISPPTPPITGAPSEEVTPPQVTPPIETPPAVEPPRPAGEGGQPIDTNAPTGGPAAPEVTPPSNVPGPPTGAGGGGVTGGAAAPGTEPPTAGPETVPVTPPVTEETAQPPTVPPAVTGHAASRAELDKRAQALGFANAREFNLRNATKTRAGLAAEDAQLLDDIADHGKRVANERDLAAIAAMHQDDWDKWNYHHTTTLSESGGVQHDDQLDLVRIGVEASRTRGDEATEKRLTTVLDRSGKRADWTVEAWNREFTEQKSQEDIDRLNTNNAEFNAKLNETRKALGIEKAAPAAAPAAAPVEEAPAATPQELYQKQTDAFDAYKALAHLRSDDPKRVAAWEAYQAAKETFQKATGKPEAPAPVTAGVHPIHSRISTTAYQMGGTLKGEVVGHTKAGYLIIQPDGKEHGKTVTVDPKDATQIAPPTDVAAKRAAIGEPPLPEKAVASAIRFPATPNEKERVFRGHTLKEVEAHADKAGYTKNEIFNAERGFVDKANEFFKVAKVTPQVPPLPGMGPIGAAPKVTYSVVPAQDGYEVHDSTGKKHGYFSSKERAQKKVAELEKGAQPPVSGPVEETPVVEEPPKAGGTGGEGGPLQPPPSKTEENLRRAHASLPRSIRAGNIPLVHVSREGFLKLGDGAGLATSNDGKGNISFPFNAEILAESLETQHQNFLAAGNTPEQADAKTEEYLNSMLVGEHGHAREYISQGPKVNDSRDRAWKEMNPVAKREISKVYDMELPTENRQRLLVAEYLRMRFQIQHGVTPDEAFINPEAYEKIQKALEEPESPFIEKILREMDDLTKQDTEQPFRNDALNELYQWYAKQDYSDAEAQKGVLASAVQGYATVDAALAVAQKAPADFTHKTTSGHVLDLESFREAVELAKEDQERAALMPSPPAPEVLSVIPRYPPDVPKVLGGPGPISDTDMSQAESLNSYQGAGKLAFGKYKMLDGTELDWHVELVDSRLVVDTRQGKNNQPGPLHPLTIKWLKANQGENYNPEYAFARVPSLDHGPSVVIQDEGRNEKQGGTRRHYLNLIEREKYEAALPDFAPAWGLNPAFVKAMQDKGGWPYLVLVIDTPLTEEQRNALNVQLNTPKAQAKDPIYEAVSSGRILTKETLDKAGELFKALDEKKTPLALLQTGAAEELAQAMLKDGAMRETDKGTYIESEHGGFTEAGAKWARLALLGNLIDEPAVLGDIVGRKAGTKLLNAIGPLFVMKARGQDMDKFVQMLRMDQERENNGWKSAKQLIANLDSNMALDDTFDRRYPDVEAMFEWFDSFPYHQAKAEFLKAVQDFFPLEKGEVGLGGVRNVDLGEGLLIRKNMETLHSMKPDKFGGMTAQEKVLKALKEKEAKGVKLTPAEHDLVLKIEKKLGQKLLIDPNKTPRDVKKADFFPKETPEIEPKRAVLGGQTDLDILAPGIEKSGQQTLFALKPQLLAIPQPPAKPTGHVKGEPFDAVFKRHQEYEKQLAKWVESIPVSAPIVLTNPERPNNAVVITPVVPRTEAAAGSKVPGALVRPTEPGQWRATTFDRPMVPQLGDNFVMKMTPGDPRPTGHDEYGSREKAVSSALYNYPKYSPEVLFARKPKPIDLPGLDKLPAIRWTELKGEGTDEIKAWHGQVRKPSVKYMINEVRPSVFAIHFFSPEGGGADSIGEEYSLQDAQSAAETHLEMWKADNRNGPVRRESYKLEGPRSKRAAEHPEFDFGAPEKTRIPQNEPVSLLISRQGMTQKSKIDFIPQRWSQKILKQHQILGANLALYAFDGQRSNVEGAPKGFLLNDGPGAGKTAQTLVVAQIMANTNAVVGKYDKEHGRSPHRSPMPEGMVHASLIITPSQRIIENAFASDAEMLGIDLWRYGGDEPKPDRVYIATYTDVARGLVPPGKFRFIAFDEAQDLRNAGYRTRTAMAGTRTSALSQHILYATATPFDKPEQIVFLRPLIGSAAVQSVFDDLGIREQVSVNSETGEEDVRFTMPDHITAADIERVKEAIFNELTRAGRMISRNVPLDNVTVHYKEVTISDEDYRIADEMYRRIYGEVAEIAAMNAGGVAGMTVRAFLETKKVPAVLKMVHESIKKGNQVIVFASRIKEGTPGSYQEGIEGTLDNLHRDLEKVYGKGTIGQVYGGDNKRSMKDIDRFQRNGIKAMLATPNSAGTGINLDDIHGDTPRDLIIVTSPLSAIELVQDIGRINRLTTLSNGNVYILFMDHPVDTWGIDIGADKMVTLTATVKGDLKFIQPLEQRTAEINLNDDAVALMTVFKREPQFQRIMRQMRTGQPGFISEAEARERLTSENKEVREEAQARVAKFRKDIQDETDRQRNNANQMSEDEIMELVGDGAEGAAFAALSPGHARMQAALERWVRENTISPTDAEMLRAFGAQATGEMLDRIDYRTNPTMKALGRGGGTFGGRGLIELQKGKKKGKMAVGNPFLSNQKGKVFLHEFGHVAYFVLLTVPERRFVARLYAKLGGRSGTQAYFVQGTPQAATSKSRYYSRTVYEFFAESFAQYVMEKRVPGEIMQRLQERVLSAYERNFELMRRRKDISREPGFKAIYDKGMDLKENTKDIDYSYPDRSSMLISTIPPKGLSRGQMERYLKNKASIHNSLALNRPPTFLPPQKHAPKFSTVQERVTPRVHPLPSGAYSPGTAGQAKIISTEPIVPYKGTLALRNQPLPKSLSEPPVVTRPVATETLLGGVKNHFFIVSTKGGHTVFMRTLPKGVAPEYIEHQPLHARSQTLPTFKDAVDVVKKTLAAGEKMGARHVWHQSALDAEISQKVPPETLQSLKPKGKKNAGQITSTTGVGVRGEGGEVGAQAPLRQPGETARQSETQKGETLHALAPGRGGGIPLRYSPEFKQPQPVSDEKLAAALTSNKAPLVGAHRTLPKGTPVSVRIDIPSFLRSGTYAQTVHAPKLGKNIGYDSIVRLDGPVSFTVREATSAKIRDQLISKAPIAAAEGKYNPDRALPADINDLSKWTPLGFDPLEHSYFYDKTNDEPVVRADEAISVGNTVYVRNPIHGSRAEFLYALRPKRVGVTVFKSGANTDSIIDAYRNTKSNIGVDIQEAQPRHIKKLAEYAQEGGKVFVDSGAFGVKQRGGTIDFNAVFEKYSSLVEQSGESAGNLNLVMPDVVGDQDATLKLLDQHEAEIKKFIASGVRAILPAQNGKLSLGEQYARYKEQFGPNITIGIPSKLDATPKQNVARFFKQSQPASVHLLGLGETNEKYLRVLQTLSPRTKLSIDATWHRARVGQGRPITEARKEIKLDRSDYTELAGDIFVGKWVPDNLKEIKALAEAFRFGGVANVEGIQKAIKEERLPEYLEEEAAFGDENALMWGLDHYSQRLTELREGPDITRMAIEDVIDRDPADPGQSGVIPAETLFALSPRQLAKVVGVNWVSSVISDIRDLAPTSKSPEHLQAAQDVGRFLGERNRMAEIAKRLTRKSWKMFVKLGADRDDLSYQNHPGTKFASAMSTGKPLTGDLLEAAELYERLFKERIVEAEKAGAPLNEIKEHYFPGYWTVQSRLAFNQAMDELIPDDEKDTIDVNNMTAAKKAEIRARVKELLEQAQGRDTRDFFSAFARRPLKGPEKFRHQSVFDDKLTGEELGLEPVYTNPADAVMAKLHELDQSIMANKIIQKWNRDGKLRIIPPTSRIPEGWREFPDPYGKVWARDASYGLNQVGKRIIPAEYADVVQNYLSDNLHQNRYFGKVYSMWMTFANVLNQTQLGIGSAFHAGFTSAEAQISAIARLMQETYGVMRGNRTMTDLLKTAKQVPGAMYNVPKDGDAVFNAYVGKTPAQDPWIKKVVRALELAGAGISLEKGLRTEQKDAAFRDYYSGRKVRAALRSPVALIELMAEPIMTFLVPRQKLGVFAHEARRLIEQNPTKSLEQLTPEFRFLWSTIDARLGQVQYKRLFVNNTAKNVTQMLVRAPGWTGGTILQLGGAIKDAGNFFKEWHDTGSLPKDLPPRTAYAISLIVTTAVMNAALTVMFTGRKPEDLDYFAFRTGREDEQGNPERFVLPTYMKDMLAYGKHPGETIMHKTHPALSLFGEIIQNKDYYGVEVRDEDANIVKQAYQSGKHIIKAFQPFWWRASKQAGERGKGFIEKIVPLAGVMPAPRSITQTPAGAEIEKYWKTHRPEAGISPEQFETQQTKRKLIRGIRKGEAPNLSEAIQTGAIKPRDISDLYKRARLGSLASSVDRMPLEVAEKVYAKANANEREQLTGILERKRAGSLRRGGRTMFTGF